MKILYGVQGTGNGHITRARALVPAIRALGVEVDVLITGRDPASLFGVEDFGRIQYREGLSFVMSQGRIRPWRTVRHLKLRHCWRDAGALDLSAYDRILSDFEPVTAWAARRQGRESIGIGHQYAFAHKVPKQGINIPSRLVLKAFAPVSRALGVHWHSFGAPLLPPVLEAMPSQRDADEKRVLVYLPFEDRGTLAAVLRQFSAHRFQIYCAVNQPEYEANLSWLPFNREGFRQDLLRCGSIVTGAGFELPAEALVLGKRLLVQPLRGQFEQESNALALQQLGRAQVMHKPCAEALAMTLTQAMPTPVHYPDVAAAVAQWLVQEKTTSIPELTQALWQQTRGLPAVLPALSESEDEISLV